MKHQRSVLLFSVLFGVSLLLVACAPPVVQEVIVTQEVDRWYEHLRARGVAFEKPPALNPKYNIYHCFLRDPNGYLIEIQRFQDPAWGST